MPARAHMIALTASLLTTLLLLALIYFGSQRLANFDAALVGYAVGTIFAAAGLAYRYTLWLSRPPTWRYFLAGWRAFLSWRNFRRYTTLIPRAWWTDIFAQTFILRRGFTRWVMHMAIFWGVVLSLLITIPLTFGWFRFTLEPPDDYQVWFVGIPLATFPLDTVLSWVIFHGLDITAVLLLVGVGIALWRRSTESGFLATQSFSFDLMPLILLFAIAVTGLTLTASTLLWEGAYFWFLSLLHQVIVVAWLLWLPFGKFFHIVERPATIGVTLYQTVNQDVGHYGGERAGGRDGADGASGSAEPGACPRCGDPMPSARFVEDLKATLGDLGQRYDLGTQRGSLQDLCPTCKRALRGEAYFELMGKRFL